jgi:hypothetical protein
MNYLTNAVSLFYIAVAITCAVWAGATWERDRTLTFFQTATPGAFNSDFGSRLPTCNTPEAKPGHLCKVLK